MVRQSTFSLLVLSCFAATGEPVIDLNQLRADALRGLVGGSGYTSGRNIQLGDHLPEEAVICSCISLSDLRAMILSEFAKAGYELAITSLSFPRNNFVVVRMISQKRMEDHVAVYMDVTKVPPLSCRVVMGAFATRLVSNSAHIASAGDQGSLASSVGQLLTKLRLGLSRRVPTDSAQSPKP